MAMTSTPTSRGSRPTRRRDQPGNLRKGGAIRLEVDPLMPKQVQLLLLRYLNLGRWNLCATYGLLDFTDLHPIEVLGATPSVGS